MKSGLKQVVEEFLETSISESPTICLLFDSLKAVAVEMKRLAELSLEFSERLDKHEKVILTILDAQKEKLNTFDLIKTAKDPSKPN